MASGRQTTLVSASRRTGTRNDSMSTRATRWSSLNLRSEGEPYNIQMEPTRQTDRAIMRPRRAAHLDRYAGKNKNLGRLLFGWLRLPVSSWHRAPARHPDTSRRRRPSDVCVPGRGRSARAGTSVLRTSGSISVLSVLAARHSGFANRGALSEAPGAKVVARRITRASEAFRHCRHRGRAGEAVIRERGRGSSTRRFSGGGGRVGLASIGLEPLLFRAAA